MVNWEERCRRMHFSHGDSGDIMIHFVGAGSGAEDLITIRGMNLLKGADIIIYAGSLVNPALLGYAKERARIFNSAVMTLEQVTDVMRAHRHKEIVRLHTGDPSLYGAVKEQMDVLDREKIPYDVTPGVSSFLAAAAALNAEYTLPAVSQTVILTRMDGRCSVPSQEHLSKLAKIGASMVIFLSAGLTQKVQEALLEGAYTSDTPAAIVYKTGWPEEKQIRCTVGTLHESAQREGITKTALILVGDFLKEGNAPSRSCLYNPDFSTEYRKSGGRRILLFGGTTEGREMARELSGRGCSVTVCVATKTGEKYLDHIPGLEVLTGRKDADQIRSLLEEGYEYCIDATHPYAVEATASIKTACRQADVPYFRLLRKKLTEDQLMKKVADLVSAYQKEHPGEAARKPAFEEQLQVILSDRIEDVLSYLLNETGESDRILLATGAKETGGFAPLLSKRKDMVFVRVLPSEESIRTCLDAGVKKENILTGKGPYPVEENVDAMRKYGIRYLVTKDGGSEGGYPEKLAAAALCRAEVIVIRRPDEEGMTAAEIMEMILQ